MVPVGSTEETKRNVHVNLPRKRTSKLKCLLILLRNKKLDGTSESFLSELIKRVGIKITTNILLVTPRNCVTCFWHFRGYY